MRVRKPGSLVRRMLRAPALLYRWNLGRLLGGRFLLLTHVGRRSGKRHQTVLEVVARRPATDEYLVIAGLGRTAGWYRNVQAAPATEVAVGRRRFRPAHRTLDEEEAADVLADYERRNRFLAPVLRRVPSWLVGWRYDGSEDARRRLIRELPMLAFRPADGGRRARRRVPRRAAGVGWPHRPRRRPGRRVRR